MLHRVEKMRELHIKLKSEEKPIIVGALIVMGEFMTTISGKNGGTINSHNKGGAYTKNFAMPTNPRTVYQVAARNLQTSFAQSWRSLTGAQRTAWNAAVGGFPYVNRVGKVCFLSGLALYIKLNVNLSLSGASPIGVPPVPSGVAAVASIVPTSVAGVVTIAYTPTPVPVGSAFNLWATPGVSPGVTNANNKFRFLLSRVAGGTSPWVVTAAYVARFGTPVVGTKLFFGLQPVNVVTGEVGIMLVASTIAV